MNTILDEFQRRVLGVLIEKAMTQPDYYPMTLNAIVTACNQKSSRDPVMQLDEQVVQRTLNELRERDLVTMVLPAPGARTQRFKHQADLRFGWNQRQQALMTELLLRGPQTAGELRSRASRMFAFEDLNAVTTALESLSAGEADPPLVATLPREPGRSAIRYTHLMYPEDETPATTTHADGGTQSAHSGGNASAEHSDAPPLQGDEADRIGRTNGGGIAPPDHSAHVDALRAEIDGLHEEIAELHEELADLRQRVDKLEKQNGMM